MKRSEYSFWDKFWKDKSGKVTLWQRPNPLLWMWIVTTLASRLATTGKPNEFLHVIAFGSIFAWAYLEITEGKSYFRRLIGGLVLIVSILSRLN